MATEDQHAKNSLVSLVEYVSGHPTGLIQGITYQDLAKRIKRVNKQGIGVGLGMGAVLGKMGFLLRGLEGEWGEPIPHIQSLVVQKTGPGKGLPSDGIEEFWPDYPKMSRREKENRTKIEHQRILVFGSRWIDVLEKLELLQGTGWDTPKPITKSTKAAKPAYGASGESQAHKDMKEYVCEHPEIVGATRNWESFVEYPLPSMDVIDVVFKSDNACIAVEVKSKVSDKYDFDYERGLYQTIKYQALLRAMSKAGGYNISPNIESVLVLESKLPEQFHSLSTGLGITVYESAREKVRKKTRRKK